MGMSALATKIQKTKTYLHNAFSNPKVLVLAESEDYGVLHAKIEDLEYLKIPEKGIAKIIIQKENHSQVTVYSDKDKKDSEKIVFELAAQFRQRGI